MSSAEKKVLSHLTKSNPPKRRSATISPSVASSQTRISSSAALSNAKTEAEDLDNHLEDQEPEEEKQHEELKTAEPSKDPKTKTLGGSSMRKTNSKQAGVKGKEGGPNEPQTVEGAESNQKAEDDGETDVKQDPDISSSNAKLGDNSNKPEDPKGPNNDDSTDAAEKAESKDPEISDKKGTNAVDSNTGDGPAGNNNDSSNNAGGGGNGPSTPDYKKSLVSIDSFQPWLFPHSSHSLLRVLKTSLMRQLIRLKDGPTRREARQQETTLVKKD
jgi:hypothetical protein